MSKEETINQIAGQYWDEQLEKLKAKTVTRVRWWEDETTKRHINGIIGNGNLTDRSISRWFDVSAFALAPSFVNGNAGRNILIGPGLENLDFALFKNFAIRERFALQFRWELFNSLNHANFGFPSATINVPATAGQIFSAASGRQMQFGLKFTF